MDVFSVLMDYEDLVGKKIVFSHMARFAEQITLATEDGYVLMATFDYDDMAKKTRIRVMNLFSVIQAIESNEWIRSELDKLGFFDVEKNRERWRIKIEKEFEEFRIKQKEKERTEYERLKAKFEK